MAGDTYFYEPSRGHRLSHDPFKAIVAPRPIGWISSIDPEGRINLAPYSFFNAFNSKPPIVAFGSEGFKDTLNNVNQTGEFVCNFVSRPLAWAMNETSHSFPPGDDEMAAAGLCSAPSEMVKPPRVARAPAALECKVLQIVSLNDVNGASTNAHAVFGQVVGVHIRMEFIKEGQFDLQAAQPIMRCGYRGDYAAIGEVFQMFRPS